MCIPHSCLCFHHGWTLVLAFVVNMGLQTISLNLAFNSFEYICRSGGMVLRCHSLCLLKSIFILFFNWHLWSNCWSHWVCGTCYKGRILRERRALGTQLSSLWVPPLSNYFCFLIMPCFFLVLITSQHYIYNIYNVIYKSHIDVYRLLSSLECELHKSRDWCVFLVIISLMPGTVPGAYAQNIIKLLLT